MPSEAASALIHQRNSGAAEVFSKLKGIIVPAGIGLPAAARRNKRGLLKRIKLTGLAPATMIKKYILAGVGHPLWGEPAEDTFGEDHAPPVALAREWRRDHPGRVHAGESGDSPSARRVVLTFFPPHAQGPRYAALTSVCFIFLDYLACVGRAEVTRDVRSSLVTRRVAR
jgi:hypothetical protein